MSYASVGPGTHFSALYWIWGKVTGNTAVGFPGCRAWYVSPELINFDVHSGKTGRTATLNAGHGKYTATFELTGDGADWISWLMGYTTGTRLEKMYCQTNQTIAAGAVALDGTVIGDTDDGVTHEWACEVINTTEGCKPMQVITGTPGEGQYEIAADGNDLAFNAANNDDIVDLRYIDIDDTGGQSRKLDDASPIIGPKQIWVASIGTFLDTFQPNTADMNNGIHAGGFYARYFQLTSIDRIIQARNEQADITVEGTINIENGVNDFEMFAPKMPSADV